MTDPIPLLAQVSEQSAALVARSAETRVSRDGEVTVDQDRIGWVDKWGPGSQIRYDWRWVLVGGRTSRVRFPTRSAALAALIQEAGRG